MSGFKLLSVRGVPITLSPTVIILAGLAAYAWASGLGPLGSSTIVVVAIAAVVGVFVSIILHELGHVFAARAFGVGTVEVTLWGLGGMARLERPAPTPLSESLISLAGPVVSLALAVIAGIAFNATGPVADVSGFNVAAYVAFQLAAWNLIIGVFNLFPGPPLDGGGIVQGIAWKITGSRDKGLHVAAYLGIATAIVAGLVALFDIVETTVEVPFLAGLTVDFGFLLLFAAVLLFLGAVPVLKTQSRQLDGSAQQASGGAPSPDQRAALATFTRAAQIATAGGSDVTGSEHVLIALVERAGPPLSIVFARHRVDAGTLYSRLVATAPSSAVTPGGAAAGSPAPPPFSVAAKQLLADGAGIAPGNVGIFCALASPSPAATLLAECGADLATMQSELTPRPLT